MLTIRCVATSNRPPTDGVDRDAVIWIRIRKDDCERENDRESKSARRANEHDWFLLMDPINHLGISHLSWKKNRIKFRSDLLFIIVLLGLFVCVRSKTIYTVSEDKFATSLSIKPNYEPLEK